MNQEKLNKCIEALNRVKKCYMCGVCSKLCTDPVALSACYHLICKEHFNSLVNCPTCGVSLDGCSAYTDVRNSDRIKDAVELGEILKKCIPKQALTEHAEGSSRSHPPQKNTAPLETTSTNINICNVSSESIDSIETHNTLGETSLHVACRHGNINKIRKLLARGVNTNTKDHDGWTPMHRVVQKGLLEMVLLLMKYNTLVDVPGPDCKTPLHVAVCHNYTEIAEKLVMYGANLNARNCKGETPLELATPRLKKKLLEASENPIHCQTVNVEYISKSYLEEERKDLRIYSVSEFNVNNTKLIDLSRHHNNLHIETEFSEKVNVLITDTISGICYTTLDVLRGIVNGVWIISHYWIMKSTERALEPLEDYEVICNKFCYGGPKVARYNKYKHLPGIFKGCHFYLHNFDTECEISSTLVLTKSDLTKLITDADGIVLEREPNPDLIQDAEKLVPYHAKRNGKLSNCSHYIIYRDSYQPMYNLEHLKALSIRWLIRCIEKYELCEPK